MPPSYVTFESHVKGRQPTPLPEVREHRLDVEDRRPVERLQVPDPEPSTLHRDDPHPVNADRIGSARLSGAEDPLSRPSRVASRVHAEDIAAGRLPDICRPEPLRRSARAKDPRASGCARIRSRCEIFARVNDQWPDSRTPPRAPTIPRRRSSPSIREARSPFAGATRMWAARRPEK